MTRKPKTARQLAESQIREELSKCGKCFVSYGTFVSNNEMLKIVQAALKEQRKAGKSSFAISTFTRAIRFPYEDDYYLVEMRDGISKVHLFNNGVVSPEVLYEEKAALAICKEHFIEYMNNMQIAFEEMGGDWEG